jgi:uncharacterized protein YaaR (DUF327 family)
MKIGRNTHLSGGKPIPTTDPRLSSAIQGKSFNELLQQQGESHSQQQWSKWMEEIHRQGERLARSMTVRELRLYRQLVRSFLDSSVKTAIHWKEVRAFDHRGRTKLYHMIEEVDQKLLEMADDLLHHEQGRIQILDRIGEIRGMLVNFYY